MGENAPFGFPRDATLRLEASPHHYLLTTRRYQYITDSQYQPLLHATCSISDSGCTVWILYSILTA